MSQEVLTELVKALERGEEVALVTIVAAQGSTPQRVGAKMIVFPDGRTVGTIGGGAATGKLPTRDHSGRVAFGGTGLCSPVMAFISSGVAPTASASPS